MSALFGYIPILLKASLLTLSLAICSFILATIFGALGAYAKLSKSRYPKEYAWVYTSVVRGIPDLVLILLIYYGLERLLDSLIALLGFGSISISAFWAGVVAIGAIYGAYLTETFRGAYIAVPQGQKEAAAALGLTVWRSFLTVVLPQLIRHAIPGYGNVFQVLIKSTAVVSAIGLNDLVGIANDAGKTTDSPFIFMFFVLVMYLIFYYFASWFFHTLEKISAEVTR